MHHPERNWAFNILTQQKFLIYIPHITISPFLLRSHFSLTLPGLLTITHIIFMTDAAVLLVAANYVLSNFYFLLFVNN